MKNKINFIALAAGISTLLLIAISQFIPWWQFTAGTPANTQVNFSPTNLNLSVKGTAVTIPLILALNIACILTLLASGIVLTIYSLKPTQPYSKHLIGFAYSKPVAVVVIFVAALIAVPLIIQALAGISLPLTGSTLLQIPNSLSAQGTNQSVNVSASINWPFYFAIIVAGLSVAARIYHRKMITNPTPSATPTPPAPPLQ